MILPVPSGSGTPKKGPRLPLLGSVRGHDVQFGLVNNPSFQPDYKKNMMTVQYMRRVGKIGLDSSAGWVATVDGTNGYAFIQQFIYDSKAKYPDDSSVEFWLNGLGEFVAWGKINSMPDNPQKNPYIFESELISPYAKLHPGQEYTFQYDWYVTKVPMNTTIHACNRIGLVCSPLNVTFEGNRISLAGTYGNFYKGYAKVVFYDLENNIVSFGSLVFPVTPMKVFHASVFSDIPVPEKAVSCAIMVYGKNHETIGRLDKIHFLK